MSISCWLHSVGICAKERPQHLECDLQRRLSPSECFTESIVLHLDAQCPVIANLVERRHEFCPINVAKARNPWRMPLFGKGEYTDFIEPVAMDSHIFGVQVKEFVLELAQGTQGVHLLED